MLSIPSYVQASGSVGAPVTYEWNDSDVPTFYTETDRIQATIAKATTAGAVALALGALEWIAWRMPHRENAEVVLQAIEAMWAGIIDIRYVRSLRHSPLALKRADWQGPERGAMYVAYKQLKDLRNCLESTEPASPEASCAIRMGRFVLPDPAPFERWWHAVLDRLVEQHPKAEEGPDDVGRPIPRDAVDPNAPYNAGQDGVLLGRFLAGLDPAGNPLLATPEEMKSAGFPGEPYRL